VSDFGVPLKSDYPTLAELQKEQGFRTAAFIGSVILDSKRLAPGIDRGFDFYDNFPEKPQMKLRWGQIERRGMDVAQRAEHWLDEHQAAPRFVWVHLYDPHDPYEPPSPYAEIYKDRLYDGEIAYADSALGHFLAYLKKRGWYDGALIVLVGDHGEGLGEHHEDTHGIFLYDSTTHVPLVLKLPNREEAGRVVDVQVRTTDIMPTILEFLRIPMPSKLDGASLIPLISGVKSASRPAFGETDYPLRFGWAPLRSVRQDGFKFIEAPRPEFYDVHSDANELHNHYAPWDATVQTLRKTLTELTGKSQSREKSSPSTVSSGTIDELHALGYLGAADSRSSTDVPEPSLLPDPKDKIEEQNLMHIATMASEVGQWVNARVALEKLVQLNDKSLLARLLLGHVYLNSNSAKAAEDQFEAAVFLQPGNMEAQLGLARALLREKKFADAVDLLEETTKSGTKDPEAFELLAQAYTGLEKPALAKQATDRANSIRGTRPQH
jgi:arylsulfatase A-like enzyme